jgi:hypothetical protein
MRLLRGHDTNSSCSATINCTRRMLRALCNALPGYGGRRTIAALIDLPAASIHRLMGDAQG